MEVDSAIDLGHSVQHLKDFKLAIEFKYLMKHAPGGVFLLPQLDDIRKLHGVIFLRRGLYRDGIFRFTMTLPKAYNAPNTHPVIVFTPPIFNPLVDAKTGVLDLRQEESLRIWMPEKHFCVTALTFLKKIFYMKSFDHFSAVSNEEARRMFESDKDGFLQRVTESVTDSLSHVYDEQLQECPIHFTDSKPAHDLIRDSILGKFNASLASSSSDGTTPAFGAKETKGTDNDGFYDVSNEVEDAEDRDSRLSVEADDADAGGAATPGKADTSITLPAN